MQIKNWRSWGFPLLLALFLVSAFYGSYLFFKKQTERFHSISRQDQDNLDWNFFQVDRTFTDIERLIESPIPLEQKATQIGHLWDVYSSCITVISTGQALTLVNYALPSSQHSNSELFSAFTKHYNQLISFQKKIDADTANGWTQESWDYLVANKDQLDTLSFQVAQQANLKWSVYLTEKQKQLEVLNESMQSAYQYEIAIILVFGFIAILQVHNLRKAKNSLQAANQTLETNQVILTETNAELITSQNQIASAFKDRTYFIAKSSHELRTPLNAIITFLDLALEENNPPSTHKHLQHAFSAANHLLVLTDDILNFSKMDSVSLSYSTWSLSDLVQDCLDMHASDIYNTNATIINNVSPLILHSDHVRTKQIVLNLLSNSLKYNTNTNPTITLSSDLTDSHLTLKIHDNGEGIPPTLLPMLFQPFSRGVSVNSAIPGTGIGLSICKKIATALQGELSLNTDLPGACFQLTLPSTLIQPTPPNITLSSDYNAPTPHSPSDSDYHAPTPHSPAPYLSQTFLFVIHNPTTYDILKNTVEPLGAEVFNIPDWETLEDIFQPDSYNWLVTDQPLPSSLQIDLTHRHINLVDTPPTSCATILTEYVRLHAS